MINSLGRALRAALAFGCMAVSAMAMAVAVAVAQDYPNRPVRVVVGFPPGSGVDIMNRIVAVGLSRSTGQTFFVENKPGASGSIAYSTVANSPPDGYTLVAASDIIASGPALHKDLPFNAEKEFRGVALVASVPFVLVTSPDVPAKTLNELIALAKSKPGALAVASTGNGSQPHLQAATLMKQAGIDFIHIPYKGSGAAINDLVAGRVHVMFANILSVAPHVRSGKLRAIAITSAQRSPQMPNVPTMIEAGAKNFTWTTWFGLAAPKATPQTVVDKLNAEVGRMLKSPEMQKTLTEQGATALGGSPAEMDAFIAAETKRYQEVVKASSIKAD